MGITDSRGSRTVKCRPLSRRGGSRAWSLALLTLVAAPALAEPLPRFSCGGVEPFWSLDLQADRATFSTPEIEAITFEVPLITTAEGRFWPRAWTLISDRDTAIAIVGKRTCNDTMSDTEFAFGIDYLSQRGTTPVIYSGCCKVIE